MKSMSILFLPSGSRGGGGFCRRPYVGPKLGTGNAENGLIEEGRFYANPTFPFVLFENVMIRDSPACSFRASQTSPVKCFF